MRHIATEAPRAHSKKRCIFNFIQFPQVWNRLPDVTNGLINKCEYGFFLGIRQVLLFCAKNGQDSAGVRQALPLSYARTERACRRPVEEASSYAQYAKLCYNFNHSTGDKKMRVYLPFIDCERKKPIALRMRIVSRHGDWRKVQLYRNPTDEIIVHSRNLHDNFMSAYKSAKRSFKRFRSSDRNRYVLTYANESKIRAL